MPKDKEGFDSPLSSKERALLLEKKAEFAFNTNRQELAAAFAIAAGIYRCASHLDEIVEELEGHRQ